VSKSSSSRRLETAGVMDDNNAYKLVSVSPFRAVVRVEDSDDD
jgi:hypothetical protein